MFQAGSFNHCSRAPASVVKESFRKFILNAIDQQLIAYILQLYKNQLKTSYTNFVAYLSISLTKEVIKTSLV